jgi:hypothetical protein
LFFDLSLDFLRALIREMVRDVSMTEVDNSR